MRNQYTALDEQMLKVDESFDIPRAIGNLEFAIQRLSERTLSLETRLSPVCRAPAPALATQPESDEASTQVGQSLLNLKGRIDYLSDVIAEVNNRLEV